jgi:hypothetical protein
MLASALILENVPLYLATDGDMLINQLLFRKEGLVKEMQQVKPIASLAVKAGLVRGE